MKAAPTKISLPFKTVSILNAREHWATKARRMKQERGVTSAMVKTLPITKRISYVITLTRLAPRKLDGDNLAGSFKAIRDGVADALGIDDGDDQIEWRYRQEKARQYGVTIEIE